MIENEINTIKNKRTRPNLRGGGILGSSRFQTCVELTKLLHRRHRVDNHKLDKTSQPLLRNSAITKIVLRSTHYNYDKQNPNATSFYYKTVE